jgi:hypothetical protein
MLEKPNPNQIVKNIETFTNLQPENGVNNFVLEGSIPDGEIRTVAAAAIFPSISLYGSPWFAIVSLNGEGHEAMAKYHSKIARLTVTERIKSYGIHDDEQMRWFYTTVSSLQGLPIITICFGQSVASGDEITIMHSIVGISPETAVREFQNQARTRLASLS